MTQRPRTVVEWMLIRAWVEPAHARPLRITVRAARRRPGPEQEPAHFADAEGATSFMRAWLAGLALPDAPSYRGGQRTRRVHQGDRPEQSDDGRRDE